MGQNAGDVTVKTPGIRWQRRRKMGRPRKKLWELAPLGKVQDTIIAEVFGVSKQAVHAARKRLGIPVYDWRKDRHIEELLIPAMFTETEKEDGEGDT